MVEHGSFTEAVRNFEEAIQGRGVLRASLAFDGVPTISTVEYLPDGGIVIDHFGGQPISIALSKDGQVFEDRGRTKPIEGEDTLDLRYLRWFDPRVIATTRHEIVEVVPDRRIRLECQFEDAITLPEYLHRSEDHVEVMRDVIFATDDSGRLSELNVTNLDMSGSHLVTLIFNYT